MKQLAGFIVRRGRLMAIVSLLSLAVAGWFAAHARIDNSIEVWMGQRSDEYRRYEDFLRRYGNDEMIVVAAEMSDPLSPSAMAAQQELAAALRKIEGIGGAVDLPDSRASLSILSPDVLQNPQNHPMIRNLLLSADGKTVGVAAWLKPLKGSEARRRIVDAVQEACAIYQRAGYEPHIVGTPVLNVALDRASSRSVMLLSPIACCLSIIVLVLLLRSAPASAACLAGAAATVLWTIALMVIAGLTLNLVSVVLPALLVVLSISPGIHLASRYMAHPLAGERTDEAMRDVLSELLIPITLTTVTTLIGFASLMVTDMEPVFEVGLFAAIGMLLALMFNVIMVPGLLMLLPVRRTTAAPAIRGHWTARLGGFSASRRRWMGALSLVLGIGLALLLPRIRTESNVLNLLPADSTVTKDYHFVSARLTGLYTLELDVAATDGTEPAAMRAIEQLAERLSTRPDVARADHYGQFASLLGAARLMESVPLVKSSTQPLKEAAARYRQADAGTVHLRMSLLVRSMASEDFYSLVAELRRLAAKLLPMECRSDVTGAVLLLNNAQSALVRTQVRSFAIAGAAVLLIMGLLFRSGRVMAAAVVPNLVPILGTFGLMVVLSIPIDSATVMIASVAIGLTVDSTIHFVACYRDANPRAGRVAAAATAMERSGRPVVFASLVAAAGFALLCLSEFRPLADFGLLTGTTLLTAMMCDLTMTPAWAVLTRLWEKQDA